MAFMFEKLDVYQKAVDFADRALAPEERLDIGCEGGIESQEMRCESLGAQPADRSRNYA